MHLLATTSTTLDETVEPVDLGQTPGDMVVLSFADSDLAALAAAWALERDALPSLRLASLRDLRHPMSVDLWIDRVAAHAKVILVRLLGGLDWWRYGVERLSTLARERRIVLTVLPGEDRDDPRLAEASTLPPHELHALLEFFREGGSDNLRALLRRLAGHAGAPVEAPEPRSVPRLAGYLPGAGAVELDRAGAGQIARQARNRSRLGSLDRRAGMAGQAPQQGAQIVTSALTEEFEQRVQLVRRKGRSFREPRIVAILARQHGEHDPTLARERRQPLDAVAPPVETAEQANEDHLGMGGDAIDPEVDRHRVAQIPQRREPQARQRVALECPGSGEGGKIAVREGQDDHVARRLAEIDRLDGLVERRGGGREQMHRSPEQRARHRGAVEPLQADDDEAAFARLGGIPWPVVLVRDARAHRLQEETHGLARDGGESLHPQHVEAFRGRGAARGHRRRR